MKYILCALVAIAPTCLMAQTIFIQPANMAHGTSLPSTCSAGDSFQLTSATSGQQWYMCEAGAWKLEGGSINVPTVSVSGATATIFVNCTASPYCNIQQAGIGTVQVNQTQTATAPSSGSATAYVYATRSATCIVSAPNTVTVSAGCSYVSGSAFPAGSIPIATIAYAAATWGTVTNLVPAISAYEDIATTTGIAVISDDGKTKTLGTDTSTASVGTGTANYVARWNGNSYTLGTGLYYDDGTKAGVGGAPDSGYTFQVVGNTTGNLYMGIDNHDTTNAGSAQACFLVNGGAAYTCFGQSGSSIGSEFSFTGSHTRYRFDVGVVVTPTTVASLPATCSQGEMRSVSDANAPTYGGTLTGGGAVTAIALCGASNNWMAH